VGDNTLIGAKAGIKKSVIGKNCNIAANVKIINCVIMDNVTIKEGYVYRLYGMSINGKIILFYILERRSRTVLFATARKLVKILAS
jgi:NDP-sugar pyrophosphorylase family protein